MPISSAILQALMSLYGIPVDKAFDVAETQPIAKVQLVLAAAGYQYSHLDRRWVLATTSFTSNQNRDMLYT